MSDQQDIMIDGFKKSEWDEVAKALDPRGGFGAVSAMLTPAVAEANGLLFSCSDPDKQLVLHEAIGFLKFANKLAELRDRARYVSERGVSPDAASRETPL